MAARKRRPRDTPRRRRRVAWVTWVAAAFLLSPAPPPEAPSTRHLAPGATAAGLFAGFAAAAEGESRQEELARIRREIGALEGRLERVRERAEGLAGELQEMEVELALQEQRLAEARSAGELAAEQAAASEEQVAALTADLEVARETLNERLGGLYRLGGQGYLRMLLALEATPAAAPSSAGADDGSAEDLLAGLRTLRYLARRDARAVEGYAAARRELEAEREVLLARRDEARRWVAEEEARRGELAAARGRLAAVLERIEGEERRLAERAGELADRERKMSRFLDLVAGGSGDDPAAGGAAPMLEVKGVLDPPVAGRVTAGFGPRRDPRYRTLVPHNGLTYATARGAAVETVYAGKVLYAAPFQGYGPTVVVHHPGRVFTLYAGLAELAVEAGDEVSLGQRIGAAGADLYFEVRVDQRPEDPAGWLR